jgi:uncharacterized iron-regulated membrane protein
MVSSTNGRMRRMWLNVHLWIGLALALLFVPISISGALLVWHDEIEALIYPARRAVTEGPSLPPSQLIANASASLGRDYHAFAVRMPQEAGAPAIVNMREGRRGEQGGRPRVLAVYLDPASGRVLDTSESRATFFGFLHRFHENLTIPEYNGRDIVGWVGVGMLIMSLTGIYLWWPRNVSFARGLRWRRGPTTSFNLHHLLGFWISIPLAAVSLTGIYLGFPQQGRQFLSSVAPMTAQQRGGFGGAPLRQMNFDADKAMAAALVAVSGAKVAAIFLPTQQNQIWRIQMRAGDAPGITTVTIDDRSGDAQTLPPLSGDRAAQWIRWIHEGSHSGPVWQIIVFLCGVFPTVFVITGSMIWLRSRAASRARMAIEPIPQVDPAE